MYQHIKHLKRLVSFLFFQLVQEIKWSTSDIKSVQETVYKLIMMLCNQCLYIWHQVLLMVDIVCFLTVINTSFCETNNHVSTLEMSRLVTKPAQWLCAQWRLRSAWASAQSDQSLRCAHEESLGPYHPLSAQRMPRLIFAGLTVILLVLSWGGSNNNRKKNLRRTHLVLAGIGS